MGCVWVLYWGVCGGIVLGCVWGYCIGVCVGIFCLDNHDGPPQVKKQKNISHLVGKPTMWFPNRSDTDRPVQLQKQARSLNFRIYCTIRVAKTDAYRLPRS